MACCAVTVSRAAQQARRGSARRGKLRETLGLTESTGLTETTAPTKTTAPTRTTGLTETSGPSETSGPTASTGLGEATDLELAGKTAVVTGTAHGIGTAIAQVLADAGARVHCVDKVQADLTSPDAVRAFFASVGPADILVNNAGGVVGQVGQPLEDVSHLEWQAVVDANLTSAFLCTRAVVPGMKERRWGRIVNISSAAGLGVSKTGIQAYASAKAGQIGFTRQMAHELGPFGITVNCIAPGFILSNPTTEAQWASYGEQGQRTLVEGIALRRLGRPQDIANGVRFFAAERSGWITGQTIAIDGGHAGL
jgi:3-oxoacyl-[acyl-carrier protein] reductase